MHCDWDISYEQCGGEERFMSRLTPEVKAQAEKAATGLLDRWTGGVYGPCPFTIRPCYDRGIQTNGEAEHTSAVVRGPLRMRWYARVNDDWSNLSCGSCGYECACGPDRATSIQLPGPVASVQNVTIDGEELSKMAYRVDHGYLIRMDGKPWPTYQDFNKESGKGTWSITYLRGLEVPAGGQVAAARLAMEFAKAMCNDSSCALPERVSSVSRQGVTIGAVLDAFEGLDEGKTGIWIVDAWVASVTKAPTTMGRVYSPDFNDGRSPIRTRGRGGWR